MEPFTGLMYLQKYIKSKNLKSYSRFTVQGLCIFHIYCSVFGTESAYYSSEYLKNWPNIPNNE